MATPYSLVYGMKVVLPVELEIPSLRIMLESKVSEEDWCQSRLDKLALLDERRLKSLYHILGYHRRIARSFNKKVKDCGVRKGDLALKEIIEPIWDPRGKFKPNWSGPYIVRKILSGGAAMLTDLDEEEMARPVNLDHLKKFYP